MAYEGDQDAINSKLSTKRDVNEIFRRAQASFNAWSKLPPAERTAKSILAQLDFDFFELLDSVTIARSRKHITTFYDTSEIGRFPERRKPLSFRCQLTHNTDVMGFNDIFTQISLLKLAVYAPISYILPSRLRKYEELYDTKIADGSKLKQADREKSLQALMTVNLLKRLESSVEAFRLTLRKLKRNHLGVLAKIEKYTNTGGNIQFTDATAALKDTGGGENEDFDAPGATIGGKIQISLSDMDVPSWEHQLRADLNVIDLLLTEMDRISPKDDAKLQHLKRQIAQKMEQPFNPGNKKVLVFTAFADTANYLYDQIANELLANRKLHTGKVTGSDNPTSTLTTTYDFQSLLTLFSPRSKEKASILPHEPGEIDLLIGTDCISEGQNLQDCDIVINYDIHWNPVRIIQRFGRIDRIGSPNSTIQLVNYWPDITLDEYINLKERVENRMVIADMTATGDDNVLGNAESSEVSYRKEQLRRLQEEVIEMEDLKTGVSITDLGLNDFRMDLLNHVKHNADLGRIPGGMHAVVPADEERGLMPGIIFTLRNRNHVVNAATDNRLHPYYLVYMGEDGQVIADHTEVKRLLDLARRACKGHSEHIPEVCSAFNNATEDGRDMHACSTLLNQAIRSIINVKEDSDINSLFTGDKTTALIDTISGLDDFELITFLVIYPTT